MILTVLTLAASLAAPDTARFQQGVDYRIEAVVDEATAVLHGRARLRYTNRSPVALDTLWFHEHLNAFRPNSAWARRELQTGNRRFQSLGPGEHAYERLTRVEAAGRSIAPVYPAAPDSTVVALPLATPLRPGETVTVELEWDARLSTLPRRQGRRGRHYDFAQWYPRIAVFDATGWQVQPLLPQGEFYGEFATYDVTLDVAADQVIGSTGVAVEGDPGWSRNARVQDSISYGRDAYPATGADALGLLAARPEADRKRVRWRAEKVHHFAWSMDPAYIYEGGSVERAGAPADPIPIHVLYQPGDTTWDEGVVVRRSHDVLAWLQTVVGPYLWPQVTNLHRFETGGTEFPMMVMNGSPSEGLIAHELSHQYFHGMLANNEFREGWMDEGFASFLDLWYLEEKGVTGLWESDMESARAQERSGLSQPVAMPGADFRDMATYNAMTYTKTALVLRMLREMVGRDTMRAILREYFRRYALQHVTEADFRAVAEEVSGRELDWFFDEWLHTTKTLDYGITRATTARLRGGGWRTRVEVARVGEAWMPVTLQVGDTTRLLDSRDRTQRVEVTTARRPGEAVLDPGDVLLDLEPSNDRAPL